jgi:hypothetical protein
MKKISSFGSFNRYEIFVEVIRLLPGVQNVSSRDPPALATWLETARSSHYIPFTRF